MPSATPTTSQDDLGLVPQVGLQSNLLTQKPRTLSCRMRGRVKVKENNSLEKAIEQTGGIEAFVFLVAKVRFVSVTGRSDWPQMGQIQDFFRSDFSTFWLTEPKCTEI